MDTILVEWDENKSKINLQKHGVHFSEEKDVFYDPNAILIPDPDHSQYEERFIMLGRSNKGNLLVVVHCYRQNESVIRIISARNANRLEESDYYSCLM